MKVVLIQRIIPHYRVNIFKALNERLNNSLVILYGDGENKGSQQNTKKLDGLNTIKLKTLKINIKFNGVKYFMPIHLNTLAKLFKVNPDVVISEGGKVNILNIYISLFYCKIKKRKLVLWVPGPLNKKTSFIKKITDSILEYAIKKSDACIAYSSMAENYLINFKKKEDIYKAQNAVYVDTNKYLKEKYIEKKDLLKKELSLENKKVILYVGALEKRKNVDSLINAMKYLDDSYRLIIVGNGEYMDKLKSIADKKTHFLGRIVEDIEVYFNLCDIFVLPGQGGLSINQAMAFGKPIICTKCDGTEEDLVKDNGVIIEDITDKKIAKSINKIFMNKSVYEEMCKNSYKIYKDVNYESMVDKIAECVTKSYLKSKGEL